MKIVEKNSGGSTTSEKRFVWVDLEIAEERDSSNNVTKNFFAQGQENGGTDYHYTRDHLGSVREMTDDSGAIEARYDSDPYGRITKLSGSGDSDFRFTGHYFHSASGLNLAPFRTYDASLGRWLSRDPMGEFADSNLYSYAFSSPTRFVDDFGLAPKISKKISGGYGVRVDNWNRGDSVDFQIHVYDKSGKEVAIVTSKGGFQRDHGGRGFNRPASTIPAAVRKDLRKILNQEVSRRNPRLTGRQVGAVATALTIAAVIQSATDGSNSETMRALQQDICDYSRFVQEGNSYAADGKAMEIALTFGDLFGNSIAAELSLAGLVSQ